MTEKRIQYAALIQAQILAMFEEDCENFINPEELNEDDNATEFIHALASMAPASIYQNLTKDKVDLLGFNHIVNRLCFQYLNKTEKEE